MTWVLYSPHRLTEPHPPIQPPHDHTLASLIFYLLPILSNLHQFLLDLLASIIFPFIFDIQQLFRFLYLLRVYFFLFHTCFLSFIYSLFYPVITEMVSTSSYPIHTYSFFYHCRILHFFLIPNSYVLFISFPKSFIHITFLLQ